MIIWFCCFLLSVAAITCLTASHCYAIYIELASSPHVFQNSDDWPITEPLPSYGQGRELPGPRHRSLIYGRNLTDIVITGWFLIPTHCPCTKHSYCIFIPTSARAGDNGTIDGQGSIWWDWFENKTLNYTRPHLVEFINSTGIVISNLTFTNSPFWAIHPIYCRFLSLHNF